MSFSADVKKELVGQTGSGRHCMIAELTAVITMCGGVRISAGDRCRLYIHTENRQVAEKCEILLKKAFQIRTECGIRCHAKRKVYGTGVGKHEDVLRVLRECHLIGKREGLSVLTDIGEELPVEENSILKRTCCRRAFLRGAFLASGSISDPKRFYHFEIVCQSPEKARQLQQIASFFSLAAKITGRKSYEILYLKDAEQIVDVLGVMEAVKSLMELENIRILREISNDINRRVNCEAANISKSVDTAVRQAEEIRFITEHGGLSLLPPGLQRIALLRLEHQDLSLQELGRLMDPPLGKSGVYHRLEKISSFYRGLKGNE